VRSASTQYRCMGATYVFTIGLLALLYINITDETVRRPLIVITGGIGLIVSVVFGLRAAWYERMAAAQKAKLQSIQGIILVAALTAYCGLGAIVSAREAWQKVGLPGAINIASVFVYSAIAIYGFAFIGLVVIFRRKR
jgi:hypothetical protein